jgi:hypothetical protein
MQEHEGMGLVWTSKMNSRLRLRPDLNECLLEDRVLPAIANFGTVILTTSGLILIIPFPGANTSGAGSLGSSGPSGGTASSVSGVMVPTSLYITGSGGISSLKPGNITGVPSLAGGITGAGGVSITIQVGSGSDTSDGPTAGGATNIVVGRATVADPTGRPTVTFIGGPLSSSSTPALAAGQTQDTAPVPPPTPTGVGAEATSPSTSSSGMNGPNPQMGAPTLGPFNSNRGGMGSPLPGSLVPITPMLPGNN